MKRKFSSVLAVFLCLLMCFSTVAVAAGAAADETPASESAAPAESAAPDDTTKASEGPEEVIYGRLDNSGRAREAYAVVTLNAAEPGTLTHYGAYTDVENLTDTSPISYSNGTVTLDAEKIGLYYYQGTLRKAQMPWDIEITYTLDGRQVDPDELGGASGELEVDIKTAPNSGFDAYFTDNYMLQISVTLDSALCEDITTRNGTVANAGSDKQITFVVLPGGEGDIGFAANVHDFAMSGFTIAAVPYSAASMMGDSEEVSGITDGLNQLSGAIGQLASGAAALRDGAVTLDTNGGAITEASDQIADALNQLSDGIQGFDISDMTSGLDQLEQLPGQLFQLAASLQGIASQVSSAIPTNIPDVSTLNAVIPAIQAGLELIDAESLNDEQTVTYQYAQQAVNGLSDSLSQISGLAEQLSGLSQLAGGLNTIADALTQMAIGVASGLEGMTDIDTSAITELQTGMAELATQYGAFNDGLKTYMDGVGQLSDGLGSYTGGAYTLNNEASAIPDLINDFLGTGDEDETVTPVSFLDERNTDTASVQFVLSTDGISAPAADEPQQPEAQSNGFFADLWDKIVDLFS